MGVVETFPLPARDLSGNLLDNPSAWPRSVPGLLLPFLPHIVAAGPGLPRRSALRLKVWQVLAGVLQTSALQSLPLGLVKGFNTSAEHVYLRRSERPKAESILCAAHILALCGEVRSLYLVLGHGSSLHVTAPELVTVAEEKLYSGAQIIVPV